MAKEIGQFLFALGSQFINAQNNQAAYKSFQYCLEMDPENDAAVYNIGTLFHLGGNFDAAHRMYMSATKMRPDNHVYTVALAEVTRKVGNFDESEKMLRSILKKYPGDFLATQALAVLMYDLGHFIEAHELNEKALEMKPDDLHLNLNRALINMTLGDWANWWWLYEKTLSYGTNPRMRSLRMEDSWNGQECEGKRLLVIADQGMGDSIQFSRYLPEAKRLGKFKEVLYLIQPDLVKLMREGTEVGGYPVADTIIGGGETQKMDFDSFSSLLGIMRVLRITPENCRREPHIFPDPTWREIWTARIRRECPDKAKLRVGLVWAGDSRHGNDTNRSMGLAQLGPLLSIPSAKFFSFQVGPPSAQLESHEAFAEIVDLGSQFRDYVDTAAALNCMDLIISVDTSVVHLAGCMGIPCWVVVPINTEWRWPTKTYPGTPWYGTVKMYKQDKPRDWATVVDRIKVDLEKLASDILVMEVA